MSGSVSAPLPDAEVLSTKIEELAEKLRSGAPGYESLLHTIHRILAADEQLAHVLKPEEIGVVVSGLAKRKNVVIAETVAKSSKKGATGMKNISLEDL